jgi:hypothetical protein
MITKTGLGLILIQIMLALPQKGSWEIGLEIRWQEGWQIGGEIGLEIVQEIGWGLHHKGQGIHSGMYWENPK